MFGHLPVSSWFFDSSVHLEAFSRLMFLVEQREALSWLTGADGSGRTLLLHRLREELERTGVQVVALNAAGLDEQILIRNLAQSVTTVARPDARTPELLSALQDEFTGRGHCGLVTVILLDDAHRAAGDLLRFCRLMLTLRQASRDTLSLVVATSQPVAGELAHQSLVQVSLSPLEQGESMEFVRSLARRFGLESATLQESALTAISAAGNGNTTSIIRICRLLRAVHETNPDLCITDATVRAVLSELAPRAAA